MNYDFEQLGPERFQHFCQALLTKLFPDVICFPIGQPDGGRDALLFVERSTPTRSVAFQIKYVRKPLAEQSPHTWLVETLSEELPKIRRLIQKGMERYYLLTNVPGTAHLDSGSIDKARDLLKQGLPIPAECWWRDDLNRRLDGFPDLRWAYPELITGSDLIKQLIESSLTDNQERRSSAVRAFIRHQYEAEKEVRFKQVELQNRLQDLFIDVPLTLRDGDQTKKSEASRRLFIILSEQIGPREDHTEDLGHRVPTLFSDPYRGLSVGAASFLLHPFAQEHFPIVVLEGAPGQGKSTISQYVCQVHRLRFLGRTAELASIAPQHSASPLRFPIRVDLRDLATWLSKRNPFSADETEQPTNWNKSLEAFLASLISHHSGGLLFSASDLISVCKSSSVLLVFDGLDEVADISKRREVVDELTKGIHRLHENCASLQVAITSRPAAFANSPGFASDTFPHCQLESLTRSLITDYAEKWLRAKKLPGRESDEVQNILRDKLEQPHLRDLAKNPMQLAILLSLIHNRGESLPDKRTELYDSYVELFLSREAQKSPVVREYRDLLINIHRYLAWILHSEAEEGRHRGNISAEQLQGLLSTYLSKEGYDPSILQTLFTGMVERVVALVSRVEGTYEFEVQPLREYFAARYLYETAPYSPAGSPKGGNIIDRFDAIARDFYWFNVCRFYAGCFSIGELPSLADRLGDLTAEPNYRHTSHPTLLAATFLSDWVFSQHPKSMNTVLSLLLDRRRGLRFLAAQISPTRRSTLSLALPKQCGRDALVDHCFETLTSSQSGDREREAVELIAANSTPREILERWSTETRNVSGASRTHWFRKGHMLGALSQLSLADLDDLVADDPENSARLHWIWASRQLKFCESTEWRFNTTVELMLDGSCRTPLFEPIVSILDAFGQILDGRLYTLSFSNRGPVPLSELGQRMRRFSSWPTERLSPAITFPLANTCRELLLTAATELSRSADEWASDLSPWDTLIEMARSLFGQRWAWFELANLSCGIRSNEERYLDFFELFDNTKSLSKRARHARLRIGNLKWWERQLKSALSTQDKAFGVLLFLTWASPTAIVRLARLVDEILGELPTEQWNILVGATNRAVFFLSEHPRDHRLNLPVDALPSSLSPRFVSALGARTNIDGTKSLYLRYVRSYNGNDPVIWNFCQKAAISLLFSEPTSWQKELKTIERSYTKGLGSWRAFRGSLRKGEGLSLKIARRVAEHPHRYPAELVAVADSSCRKDVASKIIPVGSIAKKGRWFL